MVDCVQHVHVVKLVDIYIELQPSDQRYIRIVRHGRYGVKACVVSTHRATSSSSLGPWLCFVKINHEVGVFRHQMLSLVIVIHVDVC